MTSDEEARWLEEHRTGEPLTTHNLTLSDGVIRLRPMNEDDWDILMTWNNDPEVLRYSEGGDVSARSVDEVQVIYRHVSRTALMFIIEVDLEVGRVAVGEWWLQRMNLERVLEHAAAGADVRRIDLALSREQWGRGYGTRAIRLLTAHAFDVESVDAVYGCDIHDFNAASLRAFQKAGFREAGRVAQPPGAKSAFVVDMVLREP